MEMEDKLDSSSVVVLGQSPRTTFQRQLNDDNDDDDNDDDNLLDDNDMERILSRPCIPRRKLDLFEAPEFVQRLSSYHEATVGDKVTFSGQYKAFPKPTVKWFKDEEEVTETKRHQLDLSSESSGIVRLVIQEVIKQDEGAYKCKVENQEGVASTTGYLSVSGKSSDKSHSLQSKKVAVDRVSTPPYLRPIAEQKSMEEREEKEYQCLPPSPLQEFMDKIRHSAKSIHGPIVYANLVDFYSDDDVIKDFDEDTEEDVFGENSNSTPSGSPVEEKSLGDTLYRQGDTTPRATNDAQPTPTTSVHVVDIFVSPSVDLRAAPVSTQTSNEDSAYDSDNQDAHTTTTVTDRTADTTQDSDDDVKPGSPHTSRRNRRVRLILQRSQAVEIAESDALAAVDTPSRSSTQEESLYTDDTIHETTDTDIRLEVSIIGIKPPTESRLKPSNVVAASKIEPSESTIDLVFRWLDSQWIQFFIGFVVSATSISLVADIPPIYLVAAVALLSIVCFRVLENRQKSG